MTPGDPGSMRHAAAVERAGTGFEMRTNIKARPNSQGTLFQGGKPTAQHRWVRGYTPSRMAAVAGAIENAGGIHIGAAADAGELGLSHPHYNPFSAEHTKRLMLEPLARSTYRIPDMSRLSGGIHLRMAIPDRTGEAAHYSPQEKRIVVNPQEHRGDARTQLAKADAVLMHEMGHHVDLTHNALGYDMQARMHPMGFEGIRGHLEHNADAGMIEHFRNDPRNQRRTNIDPRGLTYGAHGKGHLAGLGYTDPGTDSDDVRRERSFALKRERHHEKTGEVATQSPLHPGQFKNDVQGVLF